MTNKYIKYLNDPASRPNYDPQERPSSRFLGALKFGATALAVGIGGAGLWKSGALHEMGSLVARGLEGTGDTYRYVGAHFNAMSRALEGEGLLHFFRPDVQTRMQKNLTHNLTNLEKFAGDPLKGRTPGLFNTISEIRTEEAKLSYRGLQKFKAEGIVDELRNNTTGASEDFLTTVFRNLKDNGQRLYREYRQQDPLVRKTWLKSKLIDSGEFDIQGLNADEVVNGLYQGFDKYHRLGSSEARKAFSEKMKAELKNFEEDLIAQRTKPNFMQQQMMKMGYQPLTLGKAQTSGLLQELKVGDATVNMERWASKRKEFQNLIVDGAYTRNNKIVDMSHVGQGFNKTLDFFANNFEIPLIGINPLRLFHWISYQGIREAPFAKVFSSSSRRGLSEASKQLWVHGGKRADDDLYYSGGNVYSLFGGKVASDTFLWNGRYGLARRIMEAQAGWTREENLRPYAPGVAGTLQRIFDFGRQESQSEIGKFVGALTKGNNRLWEGKIIKDVTAGEPLYYDQFKALYNMVTGTTHPLGETTLEKLQPLVNRVYGGRVDLTNIHTDQDVMDTIQRLVGLDRRGVAGENTTQLAESGTFKRLNFLHNKYTRDRQGFMKNIRTVGDQGVYYEGFGVNIFPGSARVIRDVDDAKRLLHQEVLWQLQTNQTTRGQFFDITGGLSKGETNKIAHLGTASVFQDFMGRIESEPASLSGQLDWIGELIRDPDAARNAQGYSAFYENLRTLRQRHAPTLGAGPGWEPPNHTPSYIVGRKSRGPLWWLSQINQAHKQGAGAEAMFNIAQTGVGDIVSQLGFGSRRAGRGNLTGSTTLTAFSQFSMLRLNEALNRVGLGLGNKSLGSTQDIYTNLLLKRIVGPAAGLGYLGYMNYEAGNFFGEDPKKKLAKTYAGMTVDVATLRDTLGLTDLYKRASMILPGIGHVGDSVPGMMLKYGSFGLVGDSRSADELEGYYQNGVDPIRKGRFWGIGSNTPWRGGKIQYFAPNWYRRTMSDYKMTDVLYGSKEEYYRNWWLPTPRAPFAPVSHFITDPYHYENKHKYDRPYPVTGSYPEIEGLPIVGPFAAKALGTLGFKPPRYNPNFEKSHEQFLHDANDMVKRQYQDFVRTQREGGSFYMTAGGRMTRIAEPGNGGAGFGGDSVDGGDIGIGFGGGAVIGGDTGVSPEFAQMAQQYGGGSGTGGNFGSLKATQMLMPVSKQGDMIPVYGRPGKDMAGNQLNIINRMIVQKYRSSIQSLKDPDFIESLQESVDPNAASYRLGETMYSMTEIGGIYGFGINSLFGSEFRGRAKMLASSSYMTSPARAWWDLEMGGFGLPMVPGGNEISEIYRRFLPNNSYRRNAYNPLENKMPDWMPGTEYLTDFRHGDPYAKIPGGEMRLPGAGYESLNKLHSDPFFGKYGAFDRFKILADVAPYSSQYKYYKGILSLMNQQGMLDSKLAKEAQGIRAQIQEAKVKYDFTPYRFKYADLKRETVTVTRMIDAQTFLTKEHPGNPIRLGGIKVASKSGDPQAHMMAMDMIQKVIYPGSRIEIGLNGDPLQRVSNDTMETMRAVVYDHGVSLNAKLARTHVNPIFGNETLAKENEKDYSAVGTHARFYDDEIGIGKAWEWFAHLDTPFHTKFLQVRSPLEQYRRREVYGKNWQSWTHPYEDFIKPTLESFASHNPVVAGGYGAMLGALVGSNSKARKIGATVGAFTTALLASGRVYSEHFGLKNKTWIPERRRREREIDEYFDILKYMKYRGLYEKAKALAIRREGLDIEKYFKDIQGQGDKTKKVRTKLESVKRWLKLNRSDILASDEDIKFQLGNINDKLNGIAADRKIQQFGPYAQEAMLYRAAYESTLYGADPQGDLMQIFRALPKKDREFFPEFMNAAPEEREEILRLVPENQKRFYQAKWGLEVDKQQSLDNYFQSHNLPGANWAGWRPDVSLEDVKLKFINNEALEVQEFGYWEDDIKLASGAPRISDIHKPSNYLRAISTNISKVLRGAGLSDVLVTSAIGPSTDEHMISLKIELEKDRRGDVLKVVKDGLLPSFM